MLRHSIEQKRALQDGQDVCLTPDGPRGPRYKIQPGVIKLAESTRAPIVPIHATYSSAWRLKTWDRFVIPKPFSRVHVIFDEMHFVPPKIDDETFENSRKQLQTILLNGADDA